MTSRPPLVRSPSAGPLARSGPRCHLATASTVGSHHRGEIGDLLHRRLRLVVLIALIPSTLFLARSLLQPAAAHLAGEIGLLFHALVTMVQGGLATLLWARRALSRRELRIIELVLFGSLVVFFAWLQVVSFRNEPLFAAADCFSNLEIKRQWIGGTAVRWFFLIVIYGVFIPNTWQRCAVACVVGGLTPLVLTPLGAWWHDKWCPDVLYGTTDLAILMGTAVAVAVFGSYRLETLRQEAVKARQLGQYRLKEHLGSGGMGEVWLGEHVFLRRPCAVKLIRQDQMSDPEALHRFEREVQAIATLTHPNTVEVYDYGVADDGTFYYAMEYLPGKTLEAMVNAHGVLPPARVIHFLRQVCGALREAHAIGLLHRDIKPSNVMACRRGGVDDVAKLLDFGLVQEIGLPAGADRLTIKGTILGSPPFMAPEQAAGRADVDARADIYALGGLAYFLLTGQPPFVRETAMELLLAHAYEPVPPPSTLRPSVPADLEAVVLRCLAKKPDDRYPTAEAVEKALARCAAAGTWTQEQAITWWAMVRVQGDTAPQEMTALATPWVG